MQLTENKVSEYEIELYMKEVFVSQTISNQKKSKCGEHNKIQL
jgi:hypothetical protein